jgi:antitoxin component of MazEF toxin-antitoxin module
MKRKLVKQGAATLMVSLPCEWAKKLGLEKGDEVNLEEQDHELVISKSEIKSKRQTKINLSNHTESSIRTAIVNAYRSGYDVIEVVFQDEKKYNIIVKVLKTHLLGFEVTRKEKDYCLIENITEPSEEKFELLTKKILYNISLLMENTEERLTGKGEFKDYESIVLTIHQYDNFCRRVLSKKNLFGAQSNLFWSYLNLLIHGQRELYHLNRFLDKNPKLKFTSFAFYAETKRVFELLKEGYLHQDLKKLEQLHELEKKIIYTELYPLLEKKSGKEEIVLFHLAFAIKNFYLASSPLVGLYLSSKISQ